MIFDCRKQYKELQKSIDNEPTNKMIPLKTKGTTKYFPTIVLFISAFFMQMYIIENLSGKHNVNLIKNGLDILIESYYNYIKVLV